MKNKMKTIKIYLMLLALSIIESCYSQRDAYLNHDILTMPLVCESESKCIILNNGAIDSIVTRSAMELNTESPFTFVYLHSGKCIEKGGECIYHSNRLESPFCILEPPCCAGNVFEYRWMQYNHQQDTLEQTWLVWKYTTTKIYNKDIFWYSYPKQKKIKHLILRSEPTVNDTEEDEELRQIGNVIYEGTSGTVSVYELGYNKKQPLWKICAVQYANKNYLIGWYNFHR